MRRASVAICALLALAGAACVAARVRQRMIDRRFWRQVALDYGCN